MAKSKLRTSEMSNPSIGFEGLSFITVKSKHLKGRGDICFFVPDGAYHDLPIVILLHGVYGSSWSWALQGAAHETAERLIKERKIRPIVLAMPSDGLWGDGSGYNAHDGRDFEKWIVEDVPQAAIASVAQVSSASKQFICGLSMGGFGALRIGAKYSKKYFGISGHSSITEIGQMQQFVEEPIDCYRQVARIDEDVLSAITQNSDSLPPLRFDCGKSDLLLEHNRKLHRELDLAGIKHIYEEYEGGHSWDYWKLHLEDSLMFFNTLIKE